MTLNRGDILKLNIFVAYRIKKARNAEFMNITAFQWDFKIPFLALKKCKPKFVSSYCGYT